MVLVRRQAGRKNAATAAVKARRKNGRAVWSMMAARDSVQPENF